MSTLLRIVKVGGSLFELPDLAARLRHWCAVQSPGMNVLLAGCGPLGNSIRELDTRFNLGERPAHEMCLDALSITARLLATLLPEAVLLEDEVLLLHRQVIAPNSPAFVFHSVRFLRERESQYSGNALPVGWQVTSDSIAARLAEITQAAELVLLKSKLPDRFTQLDELAAANYVDNYFPQAMRNETDLRLVNLRNDLFPEVCY